MKVGWIVWMGCALLAAAGAGYVYWGQQESPQVLKASLSDWPGDQMLLLVDLLGEDVKQGFDLQLTSAPSPDDQTRDFTIGTTDFLLGTVDITVGFALNDLVLFYAYNDSAGGDGLIGGPGVAALSDLKGKRIGVETGFPSHFLTLNVLSRMGLTVSDVELLDIQFDEAQTAIATGRIDAVATWSPMLQDVLNSVPGTRLLASSADFPGLIVNVLTVRRDVLEQKRETFERLVRATDNVVRYCEADMTPCLARLEQSTGRSVEEWKAGFAGIKLLDLESNRALFAGNPSPLGKLVADIEEFLRSAGRPANEVGLDPGPIEASRSN